MTEPIIEIKGLGKKHLLFSAALLGLFILLGWPTLSDLADLYQTDPDFSHGFLIVPIALCLVWLRRDRIDIGAIVG